MRIAIVCPASAVARSGNRVTALRWRAVLRELGHHVTLSGGLGRPDADLVVALHAVKTAEQVARARAERPARPIVVALTGTDLYGEWADDPRRNRTLDVADRVVVLHPGAERALPRRFRNKVVFIPQSVDAPGERSVRARATFDVAIVGHLRDVKDPFRTALAARLLPRSSRIRVIQAGAALTPDMRRAAIAEARDNDRYVWLGEVSTRRARSLIASADLLALTSKLEGGANVLSEALAAGTPVVATRIACSIGLLGADYPALFRVGATTALSRLLRRAETDEAFLHDLARRCRERAPVVAPARERAAWRELIDGLSGGARSS